MKTFRFIVGAAFSVNVMLFMTLLWLHFVASAVFDLCLRQWGDGVWHLWCAVCTFPPFVHYAMKDSK